MKKSPLIFFLIVHSCAALAQQMYQFTTGLAVVTDSRYGRQAIYTDPLAYQLYTNQLKTPTEGAVFAASENGQAIKWQHVIADSANRLFIGDVMRGSNMNRGGSYFYLTYSSANAQAALLNIRGANHFYFNGELHAADPYASGWLYIPVFLKKGLNEIYVRGPFVTANLRLPERPVFLSTEDATLPHVVLSSDNTKLLGAVVVINSSDHTLQGLKIQSKLEGKEMISTIPSVPPRSTRKIAFAFDGSKILQKGGYACSLTLLNKSHVLDEKNVTIDAVNASDKYSNTFISNIDGSLQYYAVAPQVPSANTSSALFLSVHGAGVEAIGQARAYQSKDWGTLVAATNRRPRGFNWEDWGRLDALEVLDIATKTFKPDPQQIYLTGHSMGGHGTWFLGATYPDKWAAIAPCAGYPTLKEYGSADGIIPASSSSSMQEILLRSSNQSDVLKLVSNYKPLGVYIFHGDADRVVPVRYARQMRNLLGDFHPDLSYYEYPGGEHWFGDQSVDWKPIFDFFKWHKRLPDSAINTIDFITANPGISSTYRWVSVQQQIHSSKYSRVILTRNKKANSITGTTENIQSLKIDLSDFTDTSVVNITIDSLKTIQYKVKGKDSVYLEKRNNLWTLTEKPDDSKKSPLRYGTFKDPFQHRMVFVYGSVGTKEENEWSFNKARYDAETWYYRGNGAVDIISDKEYSQAKFTGRNVILYGNANTNSAYKILLKDCPIEVSRNSIKAGNEVWTGDDLGAYFVWPVKGSPINTVGVVAGSGLKGMNAANANQYFAGGSGFPDFMVFRLAMLNSGAGEVKLAGFFDNDWKLDSNQFVQTK